MACGTPVVCSNTSSLPEVVGDAAITVDPCDVEGLAEAMRAIGDEHKSLAMDHAQIAVLHYRIADILEGKEVD